MKRVEKELWEWIRAIVLAVVLALLFRLFLFEIFIVDGTSMHPTLLDGERVVVSKLVYRFNQPQRGDIIVFRYPADESRDFIKRVLAISGDEVAVKQGKVWVNGEPISEPYLSVSTEGNYGPEVVPEGTVFVLGDNRNYSRDSRDRSVGFVPYRLVKGKASLVVWPLHGWRSLH